MVRHVGNEQGSILMLSLIILVCVTISGLSVMNITSVEHQISGSDRRNLVLQQNAEAGLNYAIATFYKIYENNDGSGNPIYTHSDDYVSELKDYDDESDATIALKHIIPPLAGVKFLYRTKDEDGNDTGAPLALIEVRCLMQGSDNPVLSSVLSSAATSIPKISHIAPAPEGFDKTEHCSRLFAITSTALNPMTGQATNIILQKGYYIPVEIKKYKDWSVF